MAKLELHQQEAPSERLIDVAYRRIRHDIISCELEPGSEVTEPQLVARYGFGKAAVRSALMRLSQEKLVTAQPRRGHEITPVTLRDVHEIFQLRALLEPEAVRLAVGRVDAKRLAQLDAICSRGYQPGNRKSEDAFVQANREFHSLLIRSCGNERLSNLLHDIIDQMERLFHVGLGLSNRRAQLRTQHSDLVRAVTAGDAEAAAGLALAHVDTMRRMVIDGVMQSSSIMEVRIDAQRGLG